MRLSLLIDAARAAGHEVDVPAGVADPDILQMTIDSRKVQPDSLFAAFPGTVTDGAQFISDAVRRGARVVLSMPDVDVQGALQITSPHPRAVMAAMVARFYEKRPPVRVAVTGTNGKTSTVELCRQIWTRLGMRAASIGTLGVLSPTSRQETGMTSPDVVRFHEILKDLANDAVQAVAFEASSHALDQHRVMGATVQAAGFTNLTRDHLDYHATFEDYFAAKARIVDLLAHDGVIVVNADDTHAEPLAVRAELANKTVWRIGRRGDILRLADRHSHPAGQSLTIFWRGLSVRIELPLVGAFQAENALMAASLVIACGADAPSVFAALAHVQPISGRLEYVGTTVTGAPIYVDYAHTPDGLRAALITLRDHMTGALHVVFGCGGDRDPGKRPLMGRIANELADHIIITDDNPRNEEPASIRAAIMTTVPRALNIGDRRAAIATAMQRAQSGDLVLIAGKGHERGQIIGDTIFPFVDKDITRELLAEMAA